MRLMKFFIPSAPSRRIRSPCRPRGGGVRRFVFRAAPAVKEAGETLPGLSLHSLHSSGVFYARFAWAFQRYFNFYATRVGFDL